MEFKVLSRTKAKKYSYQVTRPTAFVSVHDVDKNVNVFSHDNHNVKGVCYLAFDDVGKEELFAMTRSDAEKVLKFVNFQLDRVEELVVHCEEGVSRSAGVCAALMKLLTGDDSQVFDNHAFSPNMHCYYMVLNTFFGSYTEEAMDKELLPKLWKYREEHGLE